MGPCQFRITFYNNKGIVSIALMAEVYADYHIVMVHIWGYGSTSDGGILMLPLSMESQ